MKTSKPYPKPVMFIRHGEKIDNTFCLDQTVELKDQNQDRSYARCRAGYFVIEGEGN